MAQQDNTEACDSTSAPTQDYRDFDDYEEEDIFSLTLIQSYRVTSSKIGE